MRARRRVLCAFPVVALVGALVALPAPSSAASAPEGYSVTTAGAAVQISSTQRPAFSIATGDLVDQTLGLVASSFGSSTSEAKAASYYPGDLIAQAGQLVCGQFGPCPFDPPAYPLLAEASWPTTSDAKATGSTASATSSSNRASTGGSDGAGTALALGGISSSTSSEVKSDGLHVHVATHVQSLTLGPLSIAAVDVSDEVLVHPDGTRVAKPRVVAAGVTVAGKPVEITSTPLPALAAQGLAVRLVGTSAAGARSEATGLRIDVSLPVKGVGAPLPGLPSLDRTYVGSVVLGQVSVVASRDDSFTLPLLPQPAPVSPAAPSLVPPSASLPRLDAPVLTQPAPPAVAPSGPGDVITTTSFGGLENIDLADLYAVLAIGSVIALLVSRVLSRRSWQDTAE